jgi:hypothetical protein
MALYAFVANSNANKIEVDMKTLRLLAITEKFLDALVFVE